MKEYLRGLFLVVFSALGVVQTGIWGIEAYREHVRREESEEAAEYRSIRNRAWDVGKHHGVRSSPYYMSDPRNVEWINAYDAGWLDARTNKETK